MKETELAPIDASAAAVTSSGTHGHRANGKAGRKTRLTQVQRNRALKANQLQQWQCDLCGYLLNVNEKTNKDHRWSRTCLKQQQTLTKALKADPADYNTDEMKKDREECEKIRKEKLKQKLENKRKRKSDAAVKGTSTKKAKKQAKSSTQHTSNSQEETT